MQSFLWDGTDLGTHHMDVIQQGAKLLKIWYSRIIIDNREGCGVLKRVKENPTIPILVDELKPIFNIRKTGTHTITFGRDRYLWTACGKIGHGIITTDIKLNRVVPRPTDIGIRQEIQDLFCFRELLSLTQTNEGSLMLRNLNAQELGVISVNELRINYEPKRPILSQVTMRKWFSEISPNEVLFRMLDIDFNNFVLGSYLAELRTKIEEVVNRVDREQIELVDVIINRIMSRIILEREGKGLH